MSKSIAIELVVAIFLGCSVLALSWAQAADKDAGQEDLTPRVWFYKDMPPEGATEDPRSPSEQYFEPFYFYPVIKTSDISVDTRKAAGDVTAGEQGTCVEIVVRLNGANDWAGVGWMAGGTIGAQPPRNIINSDNFVVGFNRPVFLKWRARTKADARLKVGFEAFGFSSGKTVDGIKPSLTTKTST